MADCPTYVKLTATVHTLLIQRQQRPTAVLRDLAWLRHDIACCCITLDFIRLQTGRLTTDNFHITCHKNKGYSTYVHHTGLSSRQLNFLLFFVCFCFVSFPADMLRFSTFCSLPDFLSSFCLPYSAFSSSFFLHGVPVRCSDDSAARFLTRGFSHLGRGDAFRIASIADPVGCCDTAGCSNTDAVGIKADTPRSLLVINYKSCDHNKYI